MSGIGAFSTPGPLRPQPEIRIETAMYYEATLRDLLIALVQAGIVKLTGSIGEKLMDEAFPEGRVR